MHSKRFWNHESRTRTARSMHQQTEAQPTEASLLCQKCGCQGCTLELQSPRAYKQKPRV